MKDVRIYNSLTDKIETFKPLKEGKVSIYVCGPTVYDHPHVGNLRPVVVFDTLRRLFMYLGYDVTFVSNYTDVDDKIIAKAQKEGKTEIEISNRYIAEFKNIVSLVNSLPPTYTPRVTEYMDGIISYIQKLIDVGSAYVAKNGDVYFRVNSVKGYGELSNMNVEDLLVGARIETNSLKESPLDFALWKNTDIGIKWQTNWSEGRPGWHTECCVMIDSIFEDGIIDIHGGGFDLKFPHHENEIAQQKASNHNKLANYWMHNGFVTFGNEKMSKSLGNIVTANDAIEQFGGLVTRLTLLSSHYRAPVSFLVNMAKSEIEKIKTPFIQAATKLQLLGADLKSFKPTNIDKFIDAMCDDLNVSNALSEIFVTVKEINTNLRVREINIETLGNLFKTLEDMLFVLGLDIKYPLLTKEDIDIYNEYQQARINKDYAKSDELRNILIERKIF